MRTYIQNNLPSGIYLRSAGLDKLAVANLKDIGYFDAPASKGHHLALKGGLVTHSVNVTRELLKLTETMGIELRPAEIAAITYHMGMFGVGKEYTDKEFNVALEFYPQQIIATHCADWWAARVTEEETFSVTGEEQDQTGGAA